MFESCRLRIGQSPSVAPMLSSIALSFCCNILISALATAKVYLSSRSLISDTISRPADKFKPAEAAACSTRVIGLGDLTTFSMVILCTSLGFEGLEGLETLVLALLVLVGVNRLLARVHQIFNIRLCASQVQLVVDCVRSVMTVVDYIIDGEVEVSVAVPISRVAKTVTYFLVCNLNRICLGRSREAQKNTEEYQH
ncbi:hypothetical protein KCU77_g42, partial [Aureobasidium melanogenum]